MAYIAKIEPKKTQIGRFLQIEACFFDKSYILFSGFIFINRNCSMRF